ncbi:hypothetical protein H6P81_003132 [Aristolochia fimbriata]|uniref:Uncharacterized protein n=1 Tax=Aristolochia fimbriata TaxID=158543 RepID=A0AAV7FCA2_ARIFI|nr:hypothetical protein H6P81_003132 [Aristolochia fimbriata]
MEEEKKKKDESWRKRRKRKMGDGGRVEKKYVRWWNKRKRMMGGGGREKKDIWEMEEEKKKKYGRWRKRRKRNYNSNNFCSFYYRRQSIAKKWYLKGLLQHFSSDLYNSVTLWQGEKKHYINEVSTVLAVLWELLTSCMPFEGFSTLQAAYAGAFKTLISNFKAEPQDYAAHLLFSSFYNRRQSIVEKWHLKRRFQHFPSGKVQIFWRNYGRWFSLFFFWL